MKKKNKILEFKNQLYVWNGEEFILEDCSRQERIKLIKDVNKLPGEMNLNEKIFLANRVGNNFLKTGIYTDLVPKSRDWISFWEREKQRCYSGLLIDGFYITGTQYWFLNYSVINDKVKKEITLPRIYDTQIWLSQKVQLAELEYEHTALVKARQKGITLWYLADMLKDFWFIQGFVGRICAPDERIVKENWKILDIYRDHLNEYTAWKRPLNPGKPMSWLQRIQMQDGTYTGLKSSLTGITIKNNPSAVVSGKVDKIYLDEFGLADNADEVLEFADPALTAGNIRTGIFNMAGAVGKLKDAGAAKKIIYSPKDYGVCSMSNVTENSDEKIGLFIPEQYSYGNCIDEFGNSLIPEALIEIEKIAEEHKKKSYKSYMIYRSQRPTILSDAFAEREENDFPIDIIQPHYEWLEKNYKPLTVELREGPNGDLNFTMGSKFPLVDEFPVKKNSIKHGSIVIDEMPVNNPPFGLYYAGVDTISPIQSDVSISLQSIYIYKASHEIDGEFLQDRVVAWYTGRTKDRYETYEITKKLIKFYNARSGIENDNKNFIEWMISRSQQRYIMKRSEFPLGKDILARSSISTTEYGIRTGNASMKNYLISLAIEYVEEIIGYRFNEKTGDSTPIYGVERIKDKMLLKEMLNYKPKKNVDRIMAFSIALFAARSNTNRGIKITSKKTQKRKMPTRTTPFSKNRNPFNNKR